jgi:GNAT superfamily N-acetyltransferase
MGASAAWMVAHASNTRDDRRLMSSDRDDSLTIRRATRSDEPFLIQLAHRLAEFEVPAWRTADEIAGADANTMIASVEAAQPDDEVLIAERDGAGVGCLHMVSVRDFFGREHAHISVIATTQAAEGSGVGRALMSHAEAWSRKRGLALLTLNVFAANTRARRLYERAGFAPEVLKYAKSL